MLAHTNVEAVKLRNRWENYTLSRVVRPDKRVKNEQLEALVRFAGTDISNWRVDPRDPGSSLMCPNTHEQAPSEWWLCRKKLRVGRLHCPRTGA